MPPKKETPNLISTRLLHKQAIAWLWKTMDILRTKLANVLISSLQKSSKGITGFKNRWDKITYKWEEACFATTCEETTEKHLTRNRKKVHKLTLSVLVKKCLLSLVHYWQEILVTRYGRKKRHNLAFVLFPQCQNSFLHILSNLADKKPAPCM